MAAKVKCPRCGEQMDREGKVKIKTRFYHPACIEDMRKENLEGEKQEKSNENDYAALIKYICDKYDLQRPTGQILKQIKSFKDEYGYKYKGMELALRYFFDLEENTVKDDTGVGIIPYVYERAKNFYIHKIEIENNLPDEEVEIRSFKSRKVESNRGKKQIDLDEI